MYVYSTLPYRYCTGTVLYSNPYRPAQPISQASQARERLMMHQMIKSTVESMTYRTGTVGGYLYRTSPACTVPYSYSTCGGGGYNILARTTRLAQSLGNVPLIRN